MSQFTRASSGMMFSLLRQARPVHPCTRILSMASHSTPQVKPNAPLTLASAQRRLRNSDHAQPFEQQNRFRKLLTHAGDDVSPDRHRHLVAGVAPETIDTAAAPGEKRLGKMIPKLRFACLQLHEVLPGDAPRAGTHKRAVRAA